MRTMALHNRNAMLLCLLGGGMMILSSVSAILGLLTEVPDGLTSLFGPEFAMSSEITMGILAVLTGFGGLGVILGGLVLTTSRVEHGRIFIMITMVMGVLGLLMILVQHALAGTIAMGLNLQVAQSLGWIGAIFALIARIIAEQQRIVE